MDKDEAQAFRLKLEAKDRENREVVSYYQDSLDEARIEIADLTETVRALKGQLQILTNDSTYEAVTIN